MTVLTFGNRISAAAWAREVTKIRFDLHRPSSAAGPLHEPVVVGLSDARSADLVILGRLLVLLAVLDKDHTSSARKHRVSLPTPDMLQSERDYLSTAELTASEQEAALRQISRHRRQRINCRMFIQQSGFLSALDSGPLKDRITIDDEQSDPFHSVTLSQQSLQPDQYDIPRDPQRRRGLIPYRWIDIIGSSNVTQTVDPLLRGVRALGIPADDATALARGVLDELLENIQHHAAESRYSHVWALCGGELTHPESYARRVDDFDGYLRNFVVWSSKAPSPLLRLFIGDPGRGISADPADPAIKPKTQDPSAVSSENPSSGDDASRQGQLILTAMDHHAAYNDSDREPRGLWKVKRVIRSFQGSLLITSGSATAGYIFDDLPEGHQINVATPTVLPGTTVECTVLTAPGRDIKPYDEELPSPVPPLASEAPNLRCIAAVLKPRVGFDSDDLATIQFNLDRMQNIADGGLVIGVETTSDARTPVGSEIQDAINSVLDIASKAANPTTVTLVFSGIGRRLLNVAIDALNQRQDDFTTSPPRLNSPILVVSPENTHYWAGGTPTIRSLLSLLSRSSQSTFAILDVVQMLRISAPAAFERDIRDQPRLLQLDKGLIRLKLRPQDAVASLTSYLSTRLASAIISAHGPGVQKGKYLTPTLRVTSRWIDTRVLLEHLRCHQMAAFLLAEAVKANPQISVRSVPPIVVRVGSIDERLAGVFSLALTGVPDTFDSVSALRISRDDAADFEKLQVVICTDLVSRGASVRRTIRQLQDLGLTEIFAATVIDGRDLAFASEEREHLRVRHTEIPIFSLASASLDSDLEDTAGAPQPIDPVTGTPLPIRYPHSKVVGRQDLYIRAIEVSGAARLGHIVRPGERHYTAYVNSSALFDYDPWADAALSRIVHYVEEDNLHVAPPDGAAVIGVLYPSETGGDFSGVATALADHIRKAKMSCAEPIGVARSSAGAGTAFPRLVNIPPEVSHIVVIDSSSKTGRTLRELIRLSSVPGIAFITCFALINGMSDLEAMALQQTRRVATYSLNDPASNSQGTTPVRVRYLVRTAVSGNAPAHCSVCALSNTFASVSQAVPRSIADHRKRLVDLLRPRSKELAYEELATDLFGVPITQEDCVAYLEWKSLFEEAAFNTSSRASVVKSLSELADAIEADLLTNDQARQRDALIRLVAAEHNRLEHAPLWFTSVRAKIVQAARSVLSIPVALTSDPLLRTQALIVLVRADSEGFCQQYADIIRMCRDHELVLTHALLEALVLLEQQWSSTDWRANLAEQLAVIANELQSDRATLGTWDKQPVEEIAYLSGVASRNVVASPNSQQQAWQELRSFSDSVKRHKYDQAMWRVQRRLENLAKGMLPSSPSDVFEDWQYCSAVLDERVLPSLRAVSGAVTRDEPVDKMQLSPDERLQWRGIANGAGHPALNELSVAMGRVFLGGEPLSVAADELDDLRGSVDRWCKFFFYSDGRSGGEDRTCLLSRIVDQCPTSVLPIVRDVFSGFSCEIDSSDMDDLEVMAFCSSKVLVDALSHIQMNADVTHRQAGKALRFGVQVASVSDDKIRIAVMNDATNPLTRGKGRGRGLETAAKALEHFGATLEVVNQVPAEWTYGIGIVLERWKWN